VERAVEEQEERQWPGRVFEDENLDYTTAMLEFVTASRAKGEPETSAETVGEAEKGTLKAEKRALRREEEELRIERRTVRQQRKQEDAAWRTLRAERKEQQAQQAELAPEERKAQEEQWQALRQQRQETVKNRKQQDQTWRAKRLSIRERWAQLPLVTAWIAILVMTDNCTRQCLGLPLFVTGPNVTSEMIVQALRVLLPSELLFLITDRGTHFTANAFQALVRREEFVHVLIARHRPQSNGIAERFVRTLKEWLRSKSWQNDQELAALLHQFKTEYDDRPHQGLPIPGLSPNEFAKRIWLM
jgi:transposase InsO family protein